MFLNMKLKLNFKKSKEGIVRKWLQLYGLLCVSIMLQLFTSLEKNSN